MSEVEFGYETLDGGTIVSKWADRQVPVAPEWVRERTQIPERYAFATLHKDTADDYDKRLLRIARTYVEQFGEVDGRGTWFTVMGESGTGKTWASAAIANEIVLRHFHGVQFDVLWLPVSWKLAELFDHRTFGQKEEYYRLRHRILGCDLLVVDDLLHAGSYPMIKEFLFGVYDYRHQHRKPIITSGNGLIKPADWSVVETAFNGPFARRLATNSRGFTFSR